MTDLHIEGPVEVFTRTIRWTYTCPLTIDSAMEAVYCCDLLRLRMRPEHRFCITAHPKDLLDFQADIQLQHASDWAFAAERGGPDVPWYLHIRGMYFFADRLKPEGIWDAWVEVDHQVVPFGREG